MTVQPWADTNGAVGRAIEDQNQRLLSTYRADHRRAEQDANIERSITEGAYARRQLFELIQNAADAMRDSRGRCEVLLTASHLYVANSGTPLTPEGVETLMASHLSTKRDDQIGRFGLGFKSVLAVTDSPMIVSRTGSLAFDRDWSAETILREIPQATAFPVTRLARPVDPRELSAADADLRSLMGWAATVVVLPLRARREILAHSVRSFPAEFLLFSSQVHRLRLFDRVANSEREIMLDRNEDDSLTLTDSKKRSRWVVTSTNHSPSRIARLDGGYQADRELVALSWAAPLEGAPRGTGRFWAFFPTEDETTLSGIVNAPWKLADDRESLLAGAFNDELLTEVLPQLITRALPAIHHPARAANVIDVLPARGKEARNHADDVINIPIMEAVAKTMCIPTLAGTLRRPRQLLMHPTDLDVDELALWAEGCRDPERWVSHTINSTERRAKVTRLAAIAGGSGVRVYELVEWVEHLVKDLSVRSSALAVRLVSMIIARRPELRETLTRCRVLLLDDGTLHDCRRGSVFLPGGNPEPGHDFIDPALASDPAVAEALGHLGIEVLDDVGALRSELSSPEIRWQRVWVSSRRLPVAEAEEVFRELLGEGLLSKLRVQTATGEWRRPGEVFLPGAVIPADAARDPAVLVHPIFHQQDVELLRRLGLVDSPELRLNPPTEPWRVASEKRIRDAFRTSRDQPRLPDAAIDIDTGRVPWPLDPLGRLSPEGRARVTEKVLRLVAPDSRWRVSRQAGGQAMQADDPVFGVLRRWGALPTPLGVQPIERCLAYDEGYAVVDGVRQPLPVVPAWVSDQAAHALRLSRDPGDLSDEAWRRLLEHDGMLSPEDRALLYAWAVLCEQKPPPLIRVVQGTAQVQVPPSHVAVALSDDVFTSLSGARCPALRVLDPDDGKRLMENWGLADGGDMLVETLDHDPDGPDMLATDRFPPLRHVLDSSLSSTRIQPCTRIELLVATPSGEMSRALRFRLEDTCLYTTSTEDRVVLAELDAVLPVRIDPDTVLRRMDQLRRHQLRTKVIATDGVPQKLLTAIGRDELMESVPPAALAALGPNPVGLAVARLALAVDGYGVFERHKRTLERQGLQPPGQWAGSTAARTWARQLGLPVEFAGFRDVRPEADFEVPGPPVLGELHDYQLAVAAQVRRLLDPTSERRRGLVALPTGAGKTRIAVQALAHHLVENYGDIHVVWLAESQELCEQAVQTWSTVWRAVGSPGRPLAIGRLWGRNVVAEQSDPHVVVATTAKLREIVDSDNWEAQYGWLRKPVVIVVDEAHRSVAPEYTRVLSAIGGSRNVAEMTTPLLGLTATPYRGFNTEETQRLADRYHGNLLDEGVFPHNDVYGFLQQRGVLARVRQIRLAGASIAFTEDELRSLAQNIWPQSFEKRLGQDPDRNTAIVDSVAQLDDNASALLFASSVENARVLAALLTYEGIEARAVSGDTSSAARRRYIDDFRERRIRVLTNYGVFTEGFDVPSVDAVVVTRPTFSPNVYQQMIGRGLRGPLNGGKEEVTVVNVDDNITNCGEKYAFTHFEHLWNRGK